MAFNIKPLLEEYLGISIKEVEIWENVFFIIPDKTSARNPRFVLKKNFIQTVFYPATQLMKEYPSIVILIMFRVIKIMLGVTLVMLGVSFFMLGVWL